MAVRAVIIKVVCLLLRNLHIWLYNCLTHTRPNVAPKDTLVILILDLSPFGQKAHHDT